MILICHHANSTLSFAFCVDHTMHKKNPFQVPPWLFNYILYGFNYRWEKYFQNYELLIYKSINKLSWLSRQSPVMLLHMQIIWCNKVTGVITTLYLSTSVDNRFHMFILVNVLLLETIVVVNTLRSFSVNWSNNYLIISLYMYKLEYFSWNFCKTNAMPLNWL